MNENATTLKDMLPFIIPLIIAQLILIIISVVDLTRRERVAGGSKPAFYEWMTGQGFLGFVGRCHGLASADNKASRYEFTANCAGYVQQNFSVDVGSGNREVTVTMKRQ